MEAFDLLQELTSREHRRIYRAMATRLDTPEAEIAAPWPTNPESWIVLPTLFRGKQYRASPMTIVMTRTSSKYVHAGFKHAWANWALGKGEYMSLDYWKRVLTTGELEKEMEEAFTLQESDEIFVEKLVADDALLSGTELLPDLPADLFELMEACACAHKRTVLQLLVDDYQKLRPDAPSSKELTGLQGLPTMLQLAGKQKLQVLCPRWQGVGGEPRS